MGRTITILMRGSNKLVLDEADRSIHDALCVVRSLVKKRYMISGGGSPEAECALRLSQWAKTLTGVRSYCVRSFAEVHLSSLSPPYCTHFFVLIITYVYTTIICIYVYVHTQALEIIPYTLAENAGINPIQLVTGTISLHVYSSTTYGVILYAFVRLFNVICTYAYTYTLYNRAPQPPQRG